MQVPAGLEDFALAELCLCLPDEWPLAINEFGWREPDFFWPIQILKQAARDPHWQNTWLCYGHTIGSVEQPTPLDQQADFSGAVNLSRACRPRRDV